MAFFLMTTYLLIQRNELTATTTIETDTEINLILGINIHITPHIHSFVNKLEVGIVEIIGWQVKLVNVRTHLVHKIKNELLEFIIISRQLFISENLIAITGSLSRHKLDCVAKLGFQSFDVHGLEVIISSNLKIIFYRLYVKSMKIDFRI